MLSETERQLSREALGSTILKNAFYITLGGLALKAINFLFRIYVVRTLGDASFGQYSTVIAFVGLFQILAEFGVSQYVMREIARDRSKTQEFFWNLVALRLVLAGVGIGVITLLAYLSGYPQGIVLGVLFYTFTFVLAALEAPLETVLAANERYDYVMAMSMIGQLVFAVLGTLVLYFHGGFIVLIAVGLLAMVPQIAFGVWAVRRHRLLSFSVSVTPRAWPFLIRVGLPFGFISLMLIIQQSIDTVMLSWWRPDYEVGWYNVAYGLVGSLMILFEGFKTAIVPSLSRAFVHDRTAVERWYARSVKMILFTSLPVAAGGMLLAEPIITFLYTEGFAPAALALKIIIWDVPFVMYAGFCGNMTTIVNEEKAAARINFVNAAANVLLNLYFIPRYGMVGAALVTVATDLIASFQFYRLLSRKLHLPNVWPTVLRIVGATILMVVGLMVVDVMLGAHLPLLVVVGGGALVYMLAAMMLRVLDDAGRLALRMLFERLRRRFFSGVQA